MSPRPAMSSQLRVAAWAMLAGSAAFAAACAGNEPRRTSSTNRTDNAGPLDRDPSALSWTHCSRDDECVLVPTIECWCGQLPAEQVRAIRRGLETAHTRAFLYRDGMPSACPQCVVLPFDPSLAPACRAGRCVVDHRSP